MADIEKVIKGLECHQIDNNHRINCTDCPYHCDEFMNGLNELHDDAIALLKEQEAVEPFHKCIGKDFSLIENSHFEYCPYCGKPITWAKQEGR